MAIKKILVIGASGQIGSELTPVLRGIYGSGNVIAGVVKQEFCREQLDSGPCEVVNVLDVKELVAVVERNNIDAIVNMAAILSSTGENNPMHAWDVNMNGLINVLEVAREFRMKQVMVPSSIAVFGPSSPTVNTPQETILKPSTMYGVTKVAGELLGDYYVGKYGLDVRGLRYPGIISHATKPGGGTTDYAVAMYFEAVRNGRYTCFVNEKTRLPMMYMPDCLKATIDLMHADFSKLRHHCDFNVGSMSFSAGELAASIKKQIPEFEINYEPDSRQAIADSWPDSVDDSAAREEWGWKPSYDLDAMTGDMIMAISKKISSFTFFSAAKKK
jgi:nucleoside-diphosphate-sugar epimerase